MLYTFCDKLILILGKRDFYKNIVFVDIVFIEFEKNYKQVIKTIFNKLRLLPKTTFYSDNKLRWYIKKKIYYYKILMNNLTYDFFNIISFYVNKGDLSILKSYSIYNFYYKLKLYYSLVRYC
jgi:hypothetical protein